MIALLSDQGTAMAETALCETHNKGLTCARVYAEATSIPDWDGRGFRDCTGNDALQCVICGATGEGA